ncbi:DUF4241 domain-containing protein [Lentzea flava]|uniref:DUF4241 domain-containing protein n=1 Tax=Lentzea flava TaxID=103732 RepID=A0ABQ2UFZ6_9PSEU|nr:DUF4241 domain-containing protein [Lentzea flava]MCP2198506.1 Protein of unknown function (DUF4241) [Lentzea flava]GGU26342.1 hypothetical protein GCM10010178_18360 [Lentzea flava]
MPLTPPDFDRLLVPGTRVDTVSGSGIVAEPLRTELSLPSGEVVASEWRWEPIGFTETAPPGRYPVLLHPLVLDGGETQAPIPLAVRLIIRDQPVASWTMALLPGQDPAELSEKGFYGFPVDGGEGSLIDAQYLRELHETGTYREFVDTAKIDLGFGELLEPYEDEDGRQTVGFTIGCDGAYPTWIGHTADGDLACYVIDLLEFGQRI